MNRGLDKYIFELLQISHTLENVPQMCGGEGFARTSMKLAGIRQWTKCL